MYLGGVYLLKRNISCFCLFIYSFIFEEASPPLIFFNEEGAGIIGEEVLV